MRSGMNCSMSSGQVHTWPGTPGEPIRSRMAPTSGSVAAAGCRGGPRPAPAAGRPTLLDADLDAFRHRPSQNVPLGEIEPQAGVQLFRLGMGLFDRRPVVGDDLLAGGGRAAFGGERHEREVDDAAGRGVGPGDGHDVQAVQVHVRAAGQGDRVVGDHPAFVAGAAVGADVVRRQVQLLGVQLGGRIVLVLGQEMLQAAVGDDVVKRSLW